VVERMLHGCDNYAPVSLPASAKVLLPDGRVMPLTSEDTRREMRTAYRASGKTATVTGAETAQGAAAADAFLSMRPPENAIVQETLDTVWWRRFWYFSLLAAIAFLAAWPFIAVQVVDALKGSAEQVAVSGITMLDVIRWIDYGVGAVTGPPAHFLQSFLPSYAEPWLKIAVFYPFATTLVVGVPARPHSRARAACLEPAAPHGGGYRQADPAALDRPRDAAVWVAAADGFHQCRASSGFPVRDFRLGAAGDWPQLFRLARRYCGIHLALRSAGILQSHEFADGGG
jgi:hypothetical protein